MSIKVQEGKHQHLAHHGLIKLILEDALQIVRLPITWTTFRDMQIEGEIKTLECDKSPTASERDEEETERDEEETEEVKEEESDEEIKEDAKEETNGLEEKRRGFLVHNVLNNSRASRPKIPTFTSIDVSRGFISTSFLGGTTPTMYSQASMNNHSGFLSNLAIVSVTPPLHKLPSREAKKVTRKGVFLALGANVCVWVRSLWRLMIH